MQTKCAQFWSSYFHHVVIEKSDYVPWVLLTYTLKIEANHSKIVGYDFPS